MKVVKTCICFSKYIGIQNLSAGDVIEVPLDEAVWLPPHNFKRHRSVSSTFSAKVTLNQFRFNRPKEIATIFSRPNSAIHEWPELTA